MSGLSQADLDAMLNQMRQSNGSGVVTVSGISTVAQESSSLDRTFDDREFCPETGEEIIRKKKRKRSTTNFLRSRNRGHRGD